MGRGVFALDHSRIKRWQDVRMLQVRRRLDLGKEPFDAVAVSESRREARQISRHAVPGSEETL